MPCLNRHRIAHCPLRHEASLHAHQRGRVVSPRPALPLPASRPGRFTTAVCPWPSLALLFVGSPRIFDRLHRSLIPIHGASSHSCYTRSDMSRACPSQTFLVTISRPRLVSAAHDRCPCLPHHRNVMQPFRTSGVRRFCPYRPLSDSTTPSSHLRGIDTCVVP